MVGGSPLPNWATMPDAEPSSSEDDEGSEEDKLHSATLKRRKGTLSAGWLKLKRQRVSSPDEKSIASSSKPASKTSHFERGNNAPSGPSKPPASIRGQPHQLPKRKGIVGSSGRKEMVGYATFPSASAGPPVRRVPRFGGNVWSRKAKEEERRPSDSTRPSLKSSVSAPPRAKAISLRNSPEVIEISSDDDNAPPPTKPPPIARVAPFQGPPSDIRIPKLSARPLPQPRRTVPSSKPEIIEIFDSDEEAPPPAEPAKPVVSSSGPTLAPAPKAAKQKKPEDQVMRDPSPEPRTSSLVLLEKAPRYVTTKSNQTHSQALLSAAGRTSSASAPSGSAVPPVASRNAANGWGADKMDVDRIATTLSSTSGKGGAAKRMTSNSSDSTGSVSSAPPPSRRPVTGRGTDKKAVNGKAITWSSTAQSVLEKMKRMAGNGSPSTGSDNSVSSSPSAALGRGADKAANANAIKPTSTAESALERASAAMRMADSVRSGSSVAPAPLREAATGVDIDKMAEDSNAVGRSSGSKCVPEEETSPKRPAKLPARPLPLPLPLPDKFRGQPAAVTSAKEDASDKSEKTFAPTSKPPLPRIPLPGRKPSSQFGPSMLAPPKSPTQAPEPKSPEPSLHVKGEPVTPSRVPIPPSPSRRSSGSIDMSRLKDVLDTTVPLSPSRPTPSIRPPLPGRQASRTSTSSSEAVSKKPSSLKAFFEGSSAKPKAFPTRFIDFKGKRKAQPTTPSSSTSSTTSRPAPVRLGSSADEAIDLTLDDSDGMVPPPAQGSLDGALKTSALLKHLLEDAKTSQAASPAAASPQSASSRAASSHDTKSRADTDELAMPPQKTSSPIHPAAPAVLKPASTITTAPKPMPLPAPRISLPGRGPKQAAASAVTTPSSEASEAARQLPTPARSPKSRPPDAATPRGAVGKRSSRSSGSESSSSSSSASEIPVMFSQVSLPHRSARKSTGRVPSGAKPLSAIASSSTPKSSRERFQSSPSMSIAAASLAPLPPVALLQPPTEAPKPVVAEIASRNSSQAAVPLAALEQPTNISGSEPVALPFASGSRASDSPATEVIPEAAVPEQTAIPSVGEPSMTMEEDDLELEYVDVPLPQPTNEDAVEEMDVEDLLTSLVPASRNPTAQEESPDLLEVAAVTEEVVEQPRRSMRSSRSSSRESLNYFPDESPLDTPVETPAPSPTPDDPCSPIPIKTWGGFPSLNWRTFRQNLDNFKPKCYFSKDLPHALQDTINRWPEHARRHPALVQVLQSAIQENTADDEPDAPPIEIINEVDDEPTPPWEFHYSNKMWHADGIPPPDVTRLVGCNCMGKCDPKSKTCSCIQRQAHYTGTSDFAYDTKGRLKDPDYPIFECNDLCGCGDQCRNRVVQHGRQLAFRIQKTAEKGWGVFAGNRKIQKGTFIGVYAGELINDDEADDRGDTYDTYGRTYLFNLDFYHLREGVDDWKVLYAVDAFHAGNFTRFINHSCDPNCQLVSCNINESDIQKPLLTVFAKRDIEAFEEICFSYYGENDEDDGSSSASRDEDEIARPSAWRCACKAPNCTGYTFR